MPSSQPHLRRPASSPGTNTVEHPGGDESMDKQTHHALMLVEKKIEIILDFESSSYSNEARCPTKQPNEDPARQGQATRCLRNFAIQAPKEASASRCCKELNQWELVLEYGSSKSCANPHLVLESAWRVPNWPLMKEALSQVHQGL
ncbi:hypothetical protein HPB51_020184 [Rhipicephalus microplus]|uniref:Uncharacterized protein n=1 Tax=Rhipicephalus microplus TaxID=6941 RepID=A0A9J6D6W9_RHIMP|nr:hypothetical protein HPB51_020184 [Rhipicephalus microplus]